MVKLVKKIRTLIADNLKAGIRFLLYKNFMRIIKPVYSLYLFLKYRNCVPKNYLSAVVIVKNEGPYIAEWIEYHLLLGVSKFYIYDNESEDNLKEILDPYIKDGIVEYKYFPGTGMQVWAYKDVLKKARKETFWLAVIDADEFIVPVSAETIPDFLKEFENYGGVGVNWLIYGSGGQQQKGEGLVIERFKDHSKYDFIYNIHIKTILNPRNVLFISIHWAGYVFSKFCVDANKNKVKKSFNSNINSLDKIRINHYVGKSREEFLLKRKRGRADVVIADVNTDKSLEQEFHKFDRNEEKNDTIMDKYIPLIYEKLKSKGVS